MLTRMRWWIAKFTYPKIRQSLSACFIRTKFRQQQFKMALQRTLRRMVTPANNMLLFCRAQSTGSAAIGILFPRKISFACLLCNLDM